MTNALTPAQAKILTFIREFLAENRMPPTVREICSHFNFKSPHAGTSHLRRLEKKGFIELAPGIARGIRLKDPVEEGIPILGEAPAGIPVTEYSVMSGMLNISQLFQEKDLFAVKVKGDSMTGCGILDGDLAIIRPQPIVPDGSIALVYVDGEATIKRIHHTPTSIRLIPENPDYEPINITSAAQNFKIAGPVTGIVRDMQKRGQR